MENSFKEEKNIDENDNESLNIKVYKYILYDVYGHDVLIIKLNKNQEHVDLAVTQGNDKRILTVILICLHECFLIRNDCK